MFDYPDNGTCSEAKAYIQYILNQRVDTRNADLSGFHHDCAFLQDSTLGQLAEALGNHYWAARIALHRRATKANRNDIMYANEILELVRVRITHLIFF